MGSLEVFLPNKCYQNFRLRNWITYEKVNFFRNWIGENYLLDGGPKYQEVWLILDQKVKG